ncbi:MAG: MOSC domain-containing protein [Phycisphaerae bacterium]|nr:MOSC domain-containing protein [Phycisphaerae bacterium]MCZ2398653.1 MOSC domain-containing protein [Phycisphaerae bacterium]NUQ48463.1 MOSC domain-containing protein [Phycisphaerae bacterium]
MSEPQPGPIGAVLAMALRTAVNGPMQEVREAVVVADGGLAGDLRSSPERGVTLISAPQWKQVCEELGVKLPWHTRRANVLLDVDRLAPLAGRRLRLGEVELDVLSETKPCGLMDQQHAGLRNALRPEWRGGVCCRVLKGGILRVGDAVVLRA